MRQRAEKDKDHTWLEAEEESHLVGEARLKDEEEEQYRLKDDNRHALTNKKYIMQRNISAHG